MLTLAFIRITQFEFRKKNQYCLSSIPIHKSYSKFSTSLILISNDIQVHCRSKKRDDHAFLRYPNRHSLSVILKSGLDENILNSDTTLLIKQTCIHWLNYSRHSSCIVRTLARYVFVFLFCFTMHLFFCEWLVPRNWFPVFCFFAYWRVRISFELKLKLTPSMLAGLVQFLGQFVAHFCLERVF